jgi:hypothetical protein
MRGLLKKAATVTRVPSAEELDEISKSVNLPALSKEVIKEASTPSP